MTESRQWAFRQGCWPFTHPFPDGVPVPDGESLPAPPFGDYLSGRIVRGADLVGGESRLYSETSTPTALRLAQGPLSARGGPCSFKVYCVAHRENPNIRWGFSSSKIGLYRLGADVPQPGVSARWPRSASIFAAFLIPSGEA